MNNLILHIKSEIVYLFLTLHNKVFGLRVENAANHHGKFRSNYGNDRGRNPISQGKNSVSDGRCCVTISGEVRVFLFYAAYYSLLPENVYFVNYIFIRLIHN